MKKINWGIVELLSGVGVAILGLISTYACQKNFDANVAAAVEEALKQKGVV